MLLLTLNKASLECHKIEQHFPPLARMTGEDFIYPFRFNTVYGWKLIQSFGKRLYLWRNINFSDYCGRSLLHTLQTIYIHNSCSLGCNQLKKLECSVELWSKVSFIAVSSMLYDYDRTFSQLTGVCFNSPIRIFLSCRLCKSDETSRWAMHHKEVDRALLFHLRHWYLQLLSSYFFVIAYDSYFLKVIIHLESLVFASTRPMTQDTSSSINASYS